MDGRSLDEGEVCGVAEMKVIYIIGPYRAKTEWEVKQNIQSAEDVALFVWQNGGAAICPHTNTAFMGGAPGTSDDTWLDGYIEVLSRCDAVASCINAAGSAGSLAELAYARERSIPIIYTYSDIVRFLRDGK